MQSSKKRKTQKTSGANNFIAYAKRQLTPAQVQRAEAKANLEILNIRLARLRESQGIKQSQVLGFAQPSVSKIEGREDIKLSTLLQYLEGIDMAIEIVVHPKGKHKEEDEIELLKTG